MTTTAPAANLPNFWDKIWKDKQGTGKVVIYQMPNLPLAMWVILTVISLMTNGTIANITSMLASLALLIWAALEVWSGVDYFRRGLGLVVFLFSIMSVYKNIFG
jgi:hypothetical protein